MVNSRINLMDASYLLMESRERPMHVATLLIYSLPASAGADFVQELVAGLQRSTEFVDPFNRRLKNPVLKFALPMWVEDFDLDLEYHVRHSALPYPGGERELGILVSRLHSNPMDFNRPLWEYHIIEGLERNRFAIKKETSSGNGIPDCSAFFLIIATRVSSSGGSMATVRPQPKRDFRRSSSPFTSFG